MGCNVSLASTIQTAFWLASGDWLRILLALTRTAVVAAVLPGKAVITQLLSENVFVIVHGEPELGVHPVWVKFEFLM